MTLSRFVIAYLIYSIVLASVALALPYFFPGRMLLADQFWLVFGFLFGITGIASIVALIGLNRKPEIGVMTILGSIAVKMLFSMAFVLIYSLNHKDSDIVFALNFFSLYLLFSFFEIYCLLRNLRHQNLK